MISNGVSKRSLRMKLLKTNPKIVRKKDFGSFEALRIIFYVFVNYD